MDIEAGRRQEVIDYVENKYGADHVSRIITFGTLAARAAVKDVGRVLDMPSGLVEQLAKAIPAEPKMTFKKAFEKSPDFKNLYDTNPSAKNIVDIAMRLEGLARHKSQHACGVIIARDPIVETCPEVMLEDKNHVMAPTAAFNMTEIENLGLLKCDFLGLRNMGVLNQCSEMTGTDHSSLTLFDPEVYEHVSNGTTDGIFQIESPGMKTLMQDMFWDVPSRRKAYLASGDTKALDALGRECFERMIAAISLYRPGPMDYIPDYVAGMKYPEKIHYDCPELEPILAKTYGVLVYQGATCS